MRRLAAVVLAIMLAIVSPNARSQAEVIAPAAGLVLEQQLNADVDARIRQAEAAAEFATLNSLLRIKAALDAVRESGGSLISHASDAANRQSYQTYLQIRSAVVATDSSISRLDTAAAQAQQVAENLPTAKRRTYIINYSPRVIAMTQNSDVRLRLSGVNFDGSKPEAKLNGKVLVVQSVGMQELVILIPRNMISRRAGTMAFNDIRVSHLAKTGFWSNLFAEDRVDRTLPLVVLPETAAKVVVNGTEQITRREYMPFSADVTLRGYGEQRRIQLPGQGWYFDLERPYDTTQGRGEAGTCYSVDRPASTRDGIVVKANNSKYGPVYRRRDGYVTCHLAATIYRDVTTSEPFSLGPQILDWTKPVYVDLPPNRSTFVAKVHLFDGTEEPVDGAKVHRYFESYLVGNSLRIEPRVPRIAD